MRLFFVFPLDGSRACAELLLLYRMKNPLCLPHDIVVVLAFELRVPPAVGPAVGGNETGAVKEHGAPEG